jgi:hypothetical protein
MRKEYGQAELLRHTKQLLLPIAVLSAIDLTVRHRVCVIVRLRQLTPSAPAPAGGSGPLVGLAAVCFLVPPGTCCRWTRAQKIIRLCVA